MNFRLWDLEQDYDILVEWWEQWNFGKVPIECLPPLGIIVENEDRPICAGGVYIGEGTKFAFMEWIVRDKDVSPKLSHIATKICFDEVINLAIARDCKLIYAVTGEEALQKRYVKYHDMVVTENSVKTFLRDIDDAYTDLEWIQDEEQFAKMQGN